MKPLIAIVACVLACVALVMSWEAQARPAARPAGVAAAGAIDRAALTTALAPGALAREAEAIVALGDRMLGAPGVERARERIAARWRASGLELLELPLSTPMPVTTRCAVTGDDGALIDVDLHPLWPDQVQAVTTPPGGLTATWMLVDDAALEAATGFADRVALIDHAAPPSLGLDASRYAALGFRAVVVADRRGWGSIDWGAVSERVVIGAPCDLPRFVAGPEAFALAGRRATIDAAAPWRAVEHTALIGVLAAARPTEEALVVAVDYDGWSVVPDRCPAALGAFAIACQQALVDGLIGQRDALRRDLIVIATAGAANADDGAASVAAAIGARGQGDARAAQLGADRDAARAGVAACDALLAAAGEVGVFVDGAATARALAASTADAAALVEEQRGYVLRDAIAQGDERALDARLALARAADDAAAETAVIAAKRAREALSAALGLPLARLVGERPRLAAGIELRARLIARLREVRRQRLERALAAEAALALNRRCARYRRLVVLSPRLAPGAGVEEIAIAFGRDIAPRGFADDVEAIAAAADRALAGSGPTRRPWTRDQAGALDTAVDGTPDPALAWARLGHGAITVLNGGRGEAYARAGDPVVAPIDATSVARSLAWLAEFSAALAGGAPVSGDPPRADPRDIGGRALIAGVGRGGAPEQPLAGALVCGKGVRDLVVQRGFRRWPLWLADVEGRWGATHSPLEVGPLHLGGFTPLIAGCDDDGRIRWIKDESASVQGVFASVGLSTTADLSRLSLVAFRAVPVAMLDVVDPRTLRAYADIQALDRSGGRPFQRACAFVEPGRHALFFLEPTARLVMRLVAGAADEGGARSTAGLLLGGPHPDAYGRGWLAADTPRIAAPQLENARSLSRLNRGRLDELAANRLADARSRAFAEKSEALVARAGADDRPALAAGRDAAAAVGYAALEYPALRAAHGEAAASALWFLVLLAPFALFVERMTVACADVRRRLAVQGLIYLAGYGALAALHPAFPLLRAPMVVLLGSLMFLIALAVAGLFVGKFRANLAGLAARRGRPAAAGIDALGALGTAVMLGLDNLGRRKARTALTCATLALLACALIAFASARDEVVDEAVALGPATWQGLLVAADDRAPIVPAEEAALRARFSGVAGAEVVPRAAWIGRHDAYTRRSANPRVAVGVEPIGEAPRAAILRSILQWSAREPLAPRLELTTARGWFTADHAGGPVPVMLPDQVARRLGITAAAVDAGPVPITLAGRPALVHGIFVARSLARLRDLDGRSPLPLDVEGQAVHRLTPAQDVLFQDGDPLLPAEAVAIAPAGDLGLEVADGTRRTIGLAVRLDGMSYAAARAEIDRHLEQTGRPANYGLDGVAWRGRRARDRSYAGLWGLAVPLAIAALSVLNVMRGSVHERRGEIAVLNAVGIAPRWIAMMFFSEALVYAVVACVMGYLVCQGIGHALVALGWNAGQDLAFASVTTIHASLAVIVATVASAWFPARAAAAIAAPADDAGWRVPEPEGESLRFALPFTCSRRDRLALLAFIGRWLRDHGEGGGGGFSADAPVLAVARDRDALGAAVPQIGARIWPKPYDLAVAQDLVISLPHDPETGEFAARVAMTRRAGARDAWLRLARPFVADLRQHVLRWRALDDAERADLAAEAHATFATAVAP
ncbi:MAG TPA: ABC transporter permease [Planctomycetota bacterium]|nr:ABC transporter permease [Planctomycetota bacterium]